MSAQGPALTAEEQAASLGRVQQLYDDGLYLQAHRQAEPLGPLHGWRGTARRILAGRLAAHLGAPRLTRWHHIHAFRSDPASAKARAYFCHVQLERRGPLAALKLLEDWGDPAAGEEDDLHYLCTLHARCLALLRDFPAAAEWVGRAESRWPDRPWLCLERASLLEQQDRPQDALAEARRALVLKPWYRPAVQQVAHLLQVLNRDEEALALLEESLIHIESSLVAAQLAALQIELGRYAGAQASLGKFESLSPLMEKDSRLWLAANRSKVEYHLGNHAAAAGQLQALEDDYHQALALRLADPAAPRRRVRLPVQFVRQHRMTCAPATLSALSQFWNRPAEHLEVAEAICYDGTPAHSERHWAESNGWVVREFTVTWEAAVALLDRGLPFTLTTTEATSGHLQGAIGYDELRRSLLLRDPSLYYAREVEAEAFLKGYAAHGPRGMVLVPPDKQAVLAEVTLPDAALYDGLHRVNRALARHDRATAAQELADLESSAPGHRLALTARRVLAAYDTNTPALLATLEALLALHPDDANLQLCRLGCLYELGRRAERLAALENLCARPQCDPVFWQQLAQELRTDARQHPVALHWARRALKWRPLDPANVATQADFLWDQRRFPEATRLYRFAACLDDFKESHARAFFAAARSLRQTEAALAFLRERVQRLGRKSGQPALTLFEALEQLDRQPEGFQVLEEALQLRPDDADLLLACADARARYAEHDQARQLLLRAETNCQRVRWLRTAAHLANYAAEHRAALGRWREVLALEPLAMDAHRAVTLLLGETEGRAAALAHLERVSADFPHHYQLLQLRLDWLREDGPEAMEPPLRQLLAAHPRDGWAHRELALLLARRNRLDDALDAAREAARIEPNFTYSHSTLGEVHEFRGEMAEAQDAYREAIRLSVDNGFAVEHLAGPSPTLAAKREALRFIESELIRQVVFGDGLLAFRGVARGILEPEELLASLRAALDARPDLWHAWSAVILQLIDLKRADDAAALAREAAARFPLLPKIWLDLAIAERARLDPAELDALQQAFRINPHWGIAARQLAASHQRAGRFDEAKTVLEGICARAPLDAFNHGALAELLWHMDRRPEALDRVQLALRLQPDHEGGWQLLRHWAKELDQPGLALQMARDLAARRSGEAAVWLNLARCLQEGGEDGEFFTTVDRALALQPRLGEAHDLKAAVLALRGRFEEAIAACRPPVFGERIPSELRGRAAWIEAARGNLPRAIQGMQAVLAEEPAYFWGWQQLADWLWRDGRHDDAVKAAEKLSSLAPFEASPLGYVAELKLRKDDRAGAKADLARALKVDPEYDYAGNALFDLQLEDHELAAAANTLAHLQKHTGGDLTLARAALLALRQRDHDLAKDIFRELCASRKDPNPWPVAKLAEELYLLGQGEAAERILREALDQPDPAPRVAEVWFKRRLDRRRWWCQGMLRKLVKQGGDAGRHAVFQYLDSLGEAIHNSGQDVIARTALRFHFWRLLRAHRHWLATDDTGWGKVGYVLANFGWHRRLARWLGDWRERPKAEAWMLHNLVLSLHVLGRDAEAAEVVRAALARPAFDEVRVRLLLWAAAEEALNGSLDGANALLEGLRPEHVPAGEQSLFQLVKLVLAFERAVVQPPNFARAERAMMKEFLDHYANNRTMQRVFLRALRRISNRTGSSWPLVWGYGWKYLPVLIGVLAAAGIIALLIWAD